MKKLRLKNNKPVLQVYQGRSSFDKHTCIHWHNNNSNHARTTGTSAFTLEGGVGLEEVRERIGEVLGAVGAEHIWFEGKTICAVFVDKNRGVDVRSETGFAPNRAGIERECGGESVCVRRGYESERVGAGPFNDREGVQSFGHGWRGEAESFGAANSAGAWVCKARVVGWGYNLPGDTNGISKRARNFEGCSATNRTSLQSFKEAVNGCRRGIGKEDGRACEDGDSVGEEAQIRDEREGGKVGLTARDSGGDRSADGVGRRVGGGDRRLRERVGGRKDSRAVSGLASVQFHIDIADKILAVDDKCSSREIASSRVSECKFAEAKQSRKEARVWSPMVSQLDRWRVCLWADVFGATERYKDAETVGRNASRDIWRGTRVLQLRSRRMVQEECEVVEENGGEENRDSAKRTGRLVCWGVGAGSGDEYASENRSDDWNSQNRVWIQQTKSKVNRDRGDGGAEGFCVKKSEQVDERPHKRGKWQMRGEEFIEKDELMA